jgi:hypothetical protein
MSIKKFVAFFEVSVDPTAGCFKKDVKGSKSIAPEVTQNSWHSENQ